MLENDFPMILHVAIALVTCLAFVLASLLSCYYCLVHMRLIQPRRTPHIARMPLQTLERWLIALLYLGLVALSLLLLTSFYWFSTDVILSPLGQLKVVLSYFAWLWLFVLVLGRRLWGWRGEFTAFAMVLGASVLCLVYLLA